MTNERNRKMPYWIACAGAGLMFFAMGAGAQQYPVKTIRFIVPYTPGGGADILARAVGAKLTEAWGQSVVVENRPGAGTNLGSEIAARSAPDGYTYFL
ncbi:MAG: tripartite tricarboxylate transporter substrate-binding protein, partial [Pseudomonadota bacterium]